MNSNANIRLCKWVYGLATAVLALLGSISTVQAAPNVTLGWNPSLDSQVTGYRLYYGIHSGHFAQSFDVGNLSTVTLSLVGGNTYYVVVTSYNAAGTESLPSEEISFDLAPDSVPVVSLVNPGQTINGPATITLNASAAVDGGLITRVEFYVGSTKLGVATASPYSIVWNDVQPGSYNLLAVAYDSNGMSGASSWVSVTVVPFGVTKLERTATGNYQLTATGAPGSTCSVYISEDLVSWRLLTTVTNEEGTMTIDDDTSNEVPRRFYKLASSQSPSVAAPNARKVARARR